MSLSFLYLEGYNVYQQAGVQRAKPFAGVRGVPEKPFSFSPPQAASQKEWKVDRNRLREKSVWERVLGSGVPPFSSLWEWVG